MTFTIRTAVLADEEVFLDLLEQLFDPPGGRPPGYTRERGSEGFRAAATNPESDVLLALDGEALVGLATVYRDIVSVRFGRRCWLQDLVTDKAQRSQGSWAVAERLQNTVFDCGDRYACDRIPK